MSSSVKGFTELLQISLAEIVEATNNFALENYVDSDGFSSTYKGQLLLGGELITIAAQKLNYCPHEGQGEAVFWKEIRVLSSLKHKHIVSFIGYCKENGEHLIINKHEVNGSLDEHLLHKTMIVTWIQRLKISVGIARALSYIHYDEGRDLSIIHRDIKSSTILLDENWVPKLSGFHLSMIIPVDERHHAHKSELYGTPAYVDPVYIKTGMVSQKSDVYCLGIVLFEILCGHKWKIENAKYHYENGKFDDLIHPDLRAQMDIQSFNLFSKTAYSCLNQDPSQRPNIIRIVRVLEKALELQQKHENPLILKVPSTVEVEDTSYRSLEGGNLQHTKIPLSDILLATENFAKKYEIASGGFGTVYKVKLDHYDRNNLRLTDGKNKSELQKKCSTVAIKRITAREDKLGEQGFDVEIKMLFNCDHPNIVSLLGFCDDGQELILVYELASNRSLEDFLENSDDILNFSLNWEQRIKICIGIACGLNYLHTERGIIHRDIKSANILLNENCDAKIADFGLSTSHPTNRQANTIQTKKLAGTPFYMDPEYEKTGILRKASDIYSFGVVLFEIMSGRLAYHQSYIKENRKGVAAIARQCFRKKTIIQKLVDPVLKEEYLSQDSLDTFSKIAYKCLDKSQANRPKAKDIIEELRKALSFQEPKEDILRIPLDNILLATQNFSMPIRSGYLGNVYKGEVTHDNEHKTIAAKRLNRRHDQGADRYAAECTVLSKYKHENVIGLVGYCEEGDEMVIIYEYASNSNLDCHLSNSDLTWMKRLNICIDVARGIDFLHKGLGTSEFVIHGNIGCDNILLDGDWKAKLSDFGISLTIPINQQMDYIFNDSVGEIGYIDPVHLSTTVLTKESDIYSLGEVLLDVLCRSFSIFEYGERGLWSNIMFAKKHFEEGTLEEIVLNCIKEQIVRRSLAIYASIAFQCLHSERERRPTASEVIVQLTQALEFQVDHEMWDSKLPKDYQNIIQLSMSPKSYSTMKKEDLYNIFSNGIPLQNQKVLSFRGNGKRNEMISARNFSYVHSCPHKWRSLPESRFKIVPQMLDVSNLMIEIMTRPRFLTPNTVYGVHLVFKFCESSTFTATPTYVNLKYRNGSETLHAYFATRKDNDWMMIELCRFLYHIEDDISFKFLLESFSPSYFKDGAVYVEGIEFRPIDKVKHKNIEKPELVLQLATDYEEILNGRYINYEDDEKLFWASEVNEKKQLMLSAKAVLYDFSDVKLFTSKASADSRFLEVIELLPQQIFYIKCIIECQMLSQDTEYVCHLVFKISEESHGLQCPVKVRDLLNLENKEPELIYFTSPRPWNLHDITLVPKQREDGWMEVSVGRFNRASDFKSDCGLVNLKFTSYEGTMSGLILCGLEFRPV